MPNHTATQLHRYQGTNSAQINIETGANRREAINQHIHASDADVDRSAEISDVELRQSKTHVEIHKHPWHQTALVDSSRFDPCQCDHKHLPKKRVASIEPCFGNNCKKTSVQNGL